MPHLTTQLVSANDCYVTERMLSSSGEELQEQREHLERNILFYEHLLIHKNLKGSKAE